VQLDPGGQQRLVRRFEGGGVALDHDRLGQLGPADGVHVAQAAAPLLEVGLEEEGDLALLGMAGAHPPADVGQPALRALAPQGQGPLVQDGGQLAVAGQAPRREQRRGRVEIARGQGQRLAGGAHGVPELEAGVPHRVPDALGGGADVDAGLVQEEHVDVAAGRQLAPAVAPDGQEGHAGGAAGVGEQLGHPRVGDVAQLAAQRHAGPGGVGDDGVAVGSEGGHGSGRPVRGRRRRTRRCGSA
jgi:hypothetical protein